MLAQWPPKLFNKLPDRIVKDLLSALHYSTGERSFQDLLHELDHGEKQLWVHSEGEKFNATIVTQVTQFPGKRTCEILYLGGDHILDCVHEISVLEDFAKREGCNDIQVIGRAGWVKALDKLGYKQRYVVTGKILC